MFSHRGIRQPISERPPSKPQRRPTLRLLLVSTYTFFLPLAVGGAGSDIISANPHRLNCRRGEGLLNPCQQQLANDSRVGLIAIHTFGHDDPTLPVDARCTYQDVADTADSLEALFLKPVVFDPNGGGNHLLHKDLEILCSLSNLNLTQPPPATNCQAVVAAYLATNTSWRPRCPGAATTTVHYNQYAYSMDRPGDPDRIATNGTIIDDPADFVRFGACQPTDTACVNKQKTGSLLKAAGFCATPLPANGLLTLATSGQGKLRWNNGPIRLGGFYWPGALTGYSTSPEVPTFTYDGYLGTLANYGINYTRVWAIDQSTSLQVSRGLQARSPTEGFTPFALTRKGYNLKSMNNVFFTRARRFMQEAAKRGIVVQYTLFDHSGLQNKGRQRGAWLDSPYNPANQCPPPTPENNEPCEKIAVSAGDSESKKAPENFLGFVDRDGTGCGETCRKECCTADGQPEPHCLTKLGEAHQLYIEETGKQLGGCKNVIFEVMNEPRQDPKVARARCDDGTTADADLSWAPNEIANWHKWASCVLKRALARPDEVACPNI